MKRKIRKFYQAVIAELTEHKITFFVYFGLRLLVLGILILQIFHQNYENAFLCILTLILMIIPSVIQATLKVEFPSPLEIIVLIFIFLCRFIISTSENPIAAHKNPFSVCKTVSQYRKRM